MGRHCHGARCVLESFKLNSAVATVALGLNAHAVFAGSAVVARNARAAKCPARRMFIGFCARRNFRERPRIRPACGGTSRALRRRLSGVIRAFGKLCRLAAVRTGTRVNSVTEITHEAVEWCAASHCQPFRFSSCEGFGKRSGFEGRSNILSLSGLVQRRSIALVRSGFGPTLDLGLTQNSRCRCFSSGLDVYPVAESFILLHPTAAPPPPPCWHIGHISGFTRRIPGSRPVARFAIYRMHPVTRSIAGTRDQLYCPFFARGRVLCSMPLLHTLQRGAITAAAKRANYC